MSLASDPIDGHLYIVRAVMERDHVGPEEALATLTEAGLVPAADVDRVLVRWREQTSTTITVLGPSELSATGPKLWSRDWDSAAGYYWPRQRRYLAHVLHRLEYEIDSLDLSSDRVLSHLEDPRPGGPDRFDIRGLVVGHVQSGKTANFSALIAKAADAGYKVVIVLSGLHNTLRQQTQRRLQRDLGHEDTPGVGQPEPGRQWVWMTNAEVWGDFNPHAMNSAVLQGNDHVILVVKKNKSRLDRLIAWMRGKVPEHVPVLVIDDEADLASVNTRGNRRPQDVVDLTADDYDGDEIPDDELDPSAINLRVRTLLRLFARRSFVAYTATPFANVLIDPDAIDREGGDDLFPRDFILSLPPPPGEGYVGSERLFGRDVLAGDPEDDSTGGLDVVEFVPDGDVGMLIPPPRGAAGFVPTVPPSLRDALRDFVLCAAGWLQRSGKDEPCTMLVHTDQRRAMQNPLASDIDGELAHIRQRWRYDREQIRPELRDRWERRFRPLIAAVNVTLDTPFEAIEPYVDDLLRDGIPVRVLNSDTPHTIDFDAEPTLKAVLVGGNKLSRGVTIEGLLVSYYVRETLYYDTLLQMARWFGYRGDFVDLTRIYSTEFLISCFHDLATAEEELRREIALYEKKGLTPLQFAPRVRTHPVMLVTAKNKMRDARVIQQSYDGRLVQTLRFRFADPSWLEHNLDATRTFLSSIGPPTDVHGTRPAWRDVGVADVQRYLDALNVIDHARMDLATVQRYISAQTRTGELIRWRVLVCAAERLRDDLGTEDLTITGSGPVPTMMRSRLKNDPSSVGVITDPGDETYGLTPEEIEDAEERAAAGEYPTRGEAYRAKRPSDEGLLLIYPISRHSQPRATASNRIALFDDPERARTVIGVALSFPASDSPATVEYVTGPASARR